MITILQGDCLDRLRELPDGCVHMCVTSPPYWGLRDYGVVGQIGLEKTPEEYVAKMVEVFREVKRVMCDDGTLWINLGDCYAQNGKHRDESEKEKDRKRARTRGYDVGGWGARGKVGNQATADRAAGTAVSGLKPKDLVGIPWRVAFALQADGWYLRSDIIWHKPNPMPESVTDRPTKSHEYIFLLSKSERYFYDAEAVKEALAESTVRIHSSPNVRPQGTGAEWKQHNVGNGHSGLVNGNLRDGSRNKRTVWTVPSAPYQEAHFATYPPDLIKPCILTGTSARGCCPHCGAPWERVTEVVGTQKMKWGTSGDDQVNARTATISGGTRMPALRDGTVQIHSTVGWQPTCTHKHEPIPCTVLDPFGGSGTTGEVAIELGRKVILIELNPKYIPLIEQRTNVTPGLPLC